MQPDQELALFLCQF